MLARALAFSPDGARSACEPGRELRRQAYAIWLTVFETIAWALFSLLAGSLAATLGIQGVFLWILVVLMIVNGLLLSVLYTTYPRDVARVARTLETRRQTLAN